MSLFKSSKIIVLITLFLQIWFVLMSLLVGGMDKEVVGLIHDYLIMKQWIGTRKWWWDSGFLLWGEWDYDETKNSLRRDGVFQQRHG